MAAAMLRCRLELVVERVSRTQTLRAAAESLGISPAWCGQLYKRAKRAGFTRQTELPL